jgi:dynein heavy chain 1
MQDFDHSICFQEKRQLFAENLRKSPKIVIITLTLNPVFLCLQVKETWQSYELDMVNYQNKCRLIRGWDDLFNKLKENINQVWGHQTSTCSVVRI